MTLKIFAPEKFEKLSIELRAELVEYVSEYREYLESAGAQNLTRDLIIEAMCDDTLKTHKDLIGFRYLEKHEQIKSSKKETENERKTTVNSKLSLQKSEKYNYPLKRKSEDSKSIESIGRKD